MKPRLVTILACVSGLTAGALARSAAAAEDGGVPRVDQRPHRVEYDPSRIAGGVLRQPLALSRLDPKRPHTLFLQSSVKPERMYARDPATGKTLAESAAYHYFKDEKGNVMYVSRLGLKAYTPDAELVVQLSSSKVRWAMLLFCDAVVTNGQDSGAGSLRDGIATVRNGGSVCFDPAVFDVPGAPRVALSGEILVGKNVDIQGTTMLPTIEVGGQDRALQFGIGTQSSMEDVILRDGWATIGGLILNRGQLTLTNVRLRESRAEADGGAIYNQEHLTLRDCTISGNQAARGGGLFNDDGEVLLFASFLVDNLADQGGGAFVVNGDLIMHDDSTIQSNEAVEGGGLYLQDASFHGNNYIYGGSVNSNVAFRGGGIYLDGGGLVIDFGGGRGAGDPLAVQTNYAVEDGGGIYVTLAGTVEVEFDNRIWSNGASGRGGGIYNLGQVTLRESSAVEANFADAGGGVYNAGVLDLRGAARIAENGADHSGGGVYNAAAATLTIWDNPCRIEDNNAVLANGSGTGGGVANFGTGVVNALAAIEIIGNQPNNLVNVP